MSQTIGNPQIAQGVINLVRAAVQVPGATQLNVTASFLGAGGVSLTPAGPTTTFIPTLTGHVISPEPFQPYTIGIHLVKSQSLAAQWEAQRVALSAIGNLLVYTDSAVLPSYAFTACAIENVGDITSNGKSVEYYVTVRGIYTVNNQLFALVV